MEHSSENSDSLKNSGSTPESGDKNHQETRVILQQISDELASLKALRNNETTRTMLYTGFLGLMLGFMFYSVTLKNNQIQDLESSQMKMKATLKRLDAELYSEIQRMDNLLSGEIPQEIPDPTDPGDSLLVRNMNQSIMQWPRMNASGPCRYKAEKRPINADRIDKVYRMNRTKIF